MGSLRSLSSPLLAHGKWMLPSGFGACHLRHSVLSVDVKWKSVVVSSLPTKDVRLQWRLCLTQSWSSVVSVVVTECVVSIANTRCLPEIGAPDNFG